MNITPVTYACDRGLIMFEIQFNDTNIGYAVYERQGMFFKIRCRCNAENTIPYDIYIQSEDKQMYLGKCSPGREIVKRVSGINIGNAHVIATQCGKYCQLEIEDIIADAAYIQKLPQAFLRQHEGKYYIQFKD